MTRRDRTLLLGLAALTLALLALTRAGVSQDVLLVAPALVLALPLLAGRYVGEERLARLAAGHGTDRRRRRRPVTSLAPRAQHAPRVLPRGGLLIAAALAVRPPPATLRDTA